MTSTSTKATVLALIAVFISVSVSSYYYETSSSPITASDTGFSVPEYDSPQEVLTELIAPFLLIFVTIQLGLQKALFFVFADDDVYGSRLSEERQKIRKYSILMSLVIAGMIIPSPLFKWFNEWVAVIFGGAMYLLLGAVGIAFLYVLWEAVG